MKRFLIGYIIITVVASVCLWLCYNRYSFGFVDKNGKLVVPIKYHYVLPRRDIYTKEMYYVGTNFFKSDVYDKTGYKFQTTGVFGGSVENLIFVTKTLLIKQVYYEDKLIANNVQVFFPVKPFVEIRDKSGYNIINTETGKMLFPQKYFLIEYKNGYFLAKGKTKNKADFQTEVFYDLYDLEGNKVFSGTFPAYDVYRDLVISGGKLYSKDGHVYNETTFGDYGIYNDKLYVVINYEPYVYNNEKNTFEPTDICYIKLDYNKYVNDNYSSFAVYKNGKYGLVIDDYESPIIYDDILNSIKGERAFIVKKGDNYGVLGPDTNIPCLYKDIDNVGYHLFRATKDLRDNPFGINENRGVKKIFTKPKPPEIKPAMIMSDRSVVDGNSNIKTAILDAKGNVIIPATNNEIRVKENAIIVSESTNPMIHLKLYIYDHKGNLKMTRSGEFRSINSNHLVVNNEYIDLQTFKSYNSLRDLILDKNPDDELLKEAEITDRYFGPGFLVKYKKPWFGK